MSFDLTNKNISDTFQNLLQKTGSDGYLYDLKGNKATKIMALVRKEIEKQNIEI